MNKKVLASLKTEAQRTKYKNLHDLFTKYIALHKTSHIFMDNGSEMGKPFIHKDGKLMGFKSGNCSIGYVGLTRDCGPDNEWNWDKAPIWIDTTANKVKRSIKI